MVGIILITFWCWCRESSLPKVVISTFYPSHNIGFLLQKSNKEVVPLSKKRTKTGTSSKYRCDIDIGSSSPQKLILRIKNWGNIKSGRIIQATPGLNNVHILGPFCDTCSPKWALLKLASFQFITSDLWRASVNWVFIRFPRQKNSDGISLKTKEIPQMAQNLGIGKPNWGEK